MGLLLLVTLMIGVGLLGSVIFLTWRTQRKPVFCKSSRKLHGKVALVTGGSSGLGKAVASELAKRGGCVYIAARDQWKGQVAAQEIQDESQNLQVRYIPLDLTDFLSIKNVASFITANHSSLDILINNAALAASHEERTRDGNDLIFTANYLGHFLLTYLLLGLLKRSEGSRVVNVSSVAHSLVKTLNLDVQSDKHGDTMYPHLQGYEVSKLALLLHVKELAKLLADSGVTVNAACPGVSMTPFWYQSGTRWPSGLAAMARCLLSPMSQTAHEACQTILYCAVAEEIEGVSGRYYERCRRKEESRLARNPDLAEKLWHISMLLTGCQHDGTLVEIPPSFRSLDADEIWRKKMERLKEAKKGKKKALLAPASPYPMVRA